MAHYLTPLLKLSMVDQLVKNYTYCSLCPLYEIHLAKVTKKFECLIFKIGCFDIHAQCVMFLKWSDLIAILLKLHWLIVANLAIEKR